MSSNEMFLSYIPSFFQCQFGSLVSSFLSVCSTLADINHIDFFSVVRNVAKKKQKSTCLFMLTVSSQLSHYSNDYCYSNYQWVQTQKWRLGVKNKWSEDRNNLNTNGDQLENDYMEFENIFCVVNKLSVEGLMGGFSICNVSKLTFDFLNEIFNNLLKVWIET